MYCISINYKTAPLQLREKAAFLEEERLFERQVMKNKEISGCVVLSTCNRSELYFTGEKDAIRIMEEALASYKKVSLEEIKKYALVFEKENAVMHLYLVASGLDSMVLGEDEILGQVRKAYELARLERATSSIINMVFQGAIRSAKKVKQMTGLSMMPVSIGTLVTHEIMHFEKEAPLEKKKVLIIGLTGKMGTLLLKNMIGCQEVEIIGTIRRHSLSMCIGSDQVQLIDYQKRYDYIDAADIIVSATTSPHYTLTYEAVRRNIQNHKKRLLIDLAMPWDIDEALSELQGITLYHLDHFEAVAKENNRLKQKKAQRGSVLLEEEVEEMMKRLYFHEHFKEIERMKNFFADKSFEKSLFAIKDVASSKEIETLFKVIERAMANE